MAGVEAPSLRTYVANAPAARFIWDRAASVRFTDLARGTSLGGRLADLAGRSVLVTTASQLTTALALIELDGVARRLVILPPDIEADHLGAVMAAAEIDAIVTDDGARPHAALRAPRARRLRAVARSARRDAAGCRSHRMGAVDLGHDGRAEDGGARPCRAHSGHHQPQRRRRRGDMGHVLRHPPLRRIADFPARDARRRFARSCRAPASRLPIISRAWRNMASRTFPARRRIGAAR